RRSPAELIHAGVITRTARGNRGHGAVRQVRRLAGLVHSVAAPAFKVGPAAESPTRFSARLSGTTHIRPERRNLILATRIRGPRAWDPGIPERADVAERSRDEPDGGIPRGVRGRRRQGPCGFRTEASDHHRR